MDITRGSLDEISRPASTSRINHGNKALSASLEFLTPEPDPPKVDFYYNGTEDHSKENIEENGAQKFIASEEISNGKSSNNCEVAIQSTSQVEECSSSPGNSGDDCAANELSSSGSGSPNKPATLQNVTTKSTNQEDSKKKDVDPLILKAIKKMKRLDQILANKQSQEKEVKKQGKEIRTKLWKELQCMASRSSSVIGEEVENTNRFLALSSPLPETPESSTAEEAVSVFHTQIHPENYECDRRTTKQGEISLIEERAKSSIKKIENMHQKSKTNCKKPPDFVKKNIELVKESANQVVMLEEEKKRLSELLRDTETESTELQIIEDEAAGSIVPGEGYTPEPMEYRYLTEINAKLKVMTSEEDLSSIQSSCSEIPKQIFQESLAYANRKLETIPGEKVLRDSKEERNQQNRLKEIDQQLKNLEETPDVLPRLSEEQLSALLEECMQTLRRVHGLTFTKSQESFSEGRSPRYDIVQNTIPNSRNESLDDVQSGRMLVSQEMVASEDKDMSAADTMEACGLKFSQPLIDSPLTEQKENDNEDIQEKTVPRNTSESYFMSLALSTNRPQKPFLETFLSISPNNELSTDVSIPSMPLKTREDELTDEDGNEE